MPAVGGGRSRSYQGMWLIDDDGEMWPRDSVELSRKLGTRLRGAALEDFLMRQSGFALVRLTGALVECVFDPEVVSPGALVGLLYVIGENGHLPVAIRSPADPIRVDMLCDRRRAIAQVSQLIELKRQRPRFDRRPCVIEKTGFAGRWEVAREILVSPMDESVRMHLLNTMFRGQFTLNSLDESDGSFRIDLIGHVIAGYDPRFAAKGQGMTYHSLSDPKYGEWVSDSLRNYTTQSRIHTELVDALVENPGVEPRRLSYVRLALPYSSDLRRRLLVATDFH